MQRIVFDASYLVLGLGDVYLGAPVATPVDPRHRLVTTKYNPARTWTPENAVGIGGAYLCVYGMEGPGGYQFVGRTVQMWNTHRTTAEFEPGTPWLLRFFDQIRFYPVSAPRSCSKCATRFRTGSTASRIEPTDVQPARLPRVPARRSTPKRARVQAAPAGGLRRRARALGRRRPAGRSWSRRTTCRRRPRPTFPKAARPVRSPMTASVWQVAVEPGQRVEAGQKLLVLEAMKMEVAIVGADATASWSWCTARKGALVTAGQNLATLRECEVTMQLDLGSLRTVQSGARRRGRRRDDLRRIEADGLRPGLDFARADARRRIRARAS